MHRLNLSRATFGDFMVQSMKQSNVIKAFNTHLKNPPFDEDTFVHCKPEETTVLMAWFQRFLPDGTTIKMMDVE